MSSRIQPRWTLDGGPASLRLWLVGLVIVGVVGSAAMGYLLSFLQAPQYRADAYLYLATTRPFDPLQPVGAANAADHARYLETQSELLTTDGVLSAAASTLASHPTVSSLRSRVAGLSDGTNNVLTVRARAGTPEQAAATADAIALAYRHVVAAQVTNTAQDAASRLQGAAAATVRASAAAYGDGVFEYEAARLPTAKTLPARSTDAVLGGLVGLLLSAGYLCWRRQSLPRDAQTDPTVVLGAPYLGTIRPASAGDAAAAFKGGQAVLTALEYAHGAAPSGSLLVLGIKPGIGATRVVATMAAASVRQGRHTIVVDAGLNPSLTRLAGAGRLPERALAQLANGSATMRELGQTWPLAPGLTVGLFSCLPGPQGTTRAAIAHLRSEADLVLIDGPALPSREAFALAGCVDAVLLVVDVAATEGELSEARELIEETGSLLVGFTTVRPVSAAKSRQRSPVPNSGALTSGART